MKVYVTAVFQQYELYSVEWDIGGYSGRKEGCLREWSWSVLWRWSQAETTKRSVGILSRLFFDSETIDNERPNRWDSAIGIATGYGLDDWEVGVRVPAGSRIFTSPCCPDRLWVPASLISSGQRGLFPWGVKLTTHLQQVPSGEFSICVWIVHEVHF
jgi:hypothetical protein